MSLRAGILAAMAVFALALFSLWVFAPSALAQLPRLPDRDTLEVLVARVGA
jgi:hypothetical protein